MITNLFLQVAPDKELAFCVEHKRKFSRRSAEILRELACIVPDGKVTLHPTLRGKNVVQFGPRMSMVSPWSDSAVEILRGCGIKAERFEMLRRVVVPDGQDLSGLFDRMTEQVYNKQISTFRKKIEIPKVKIVPVLQEGKQALRKLGEELHLGFDEQDIEIYHHLFVDILKRNPTDVELFVLGQVNSNHCRHLDWNAIWDIDGKEQKETLFDLIKRPYLSKGSDHILVAFHDNSSVIAGYPIRVAVPRYPWKSSEYVLITVYADGTLTFETHNHPTGVAPYPGAGTGTGGRMRDGKAVGVGGRLLAACAAFLTADLNLQGYHLPWEKRNQKYPPNLASAAEIQRLATDGACDYNNPVGEPVILGCKRAIEMEMPPGVASNGKKVSSHRRAWFKPIMASGGVGYARREHAFKEKAVKGMHIVMIGGKAHNVGFAGGSGSSQTSDSNKTEQDQNSVQRASAGTAIRDHRVIDACIAMGRKNPICSIHDQGAGGVINVLMELVDPVGGEIQGGKIQLGDETLPFIVRLGAEYQERYGLLVKPAGLPVFLKICEREKCGVEVLGKITGNGKFVARNNISGDHKKPINFTLSAVMADMPRKRFSDWTVKYGFNPLRLPKSATIKSALNRVLKNLAVASAEMYTLKGDRSVGGLVVGQQHCGTVSLPVADCAISALSHFSRQGIAFAIGEQPLKLMLNPASGARMGAAEALLNMAGAVVEDVAKIVTSVNWMWPLKFLGEGAANFAACRALSEFLVGFGIPVRGKDSSSMMVKFNGEVVPAPREVMLTLQGMMPDCRKFVTPDIKQPGGSDLVLVDLGLGKNRMGGSILGQCYNQWGNDCPDIDPQLLRNAFNAIQELVRRDWILSYHDRSDGGLIVTLLEMAFAGNCGFVADIGHHNPMRALFSEEAGAVLETPTIVTFQTIDVLKSFGVTAKAIGRTTKAKDIQILQGRLIPVFDAGMEDLCETWRETSHQLRLRQMNPECVLAEKENTRTRKGIRYIFPANWEGKPQFKVRRAKHQPKALIFRSLGTNSEDEMNASLMQAGFKTQNVIMSDLETGVFKNLNEFSVLAACGGFSDNDVLGSARGWAAKIFYNPGIRRMIWDFLARGDTLSYWVCNGAQLGGELGVMMPNLPPVNAKRAKNRPRFIYNVSRKFEARFPLVAVHPGPAIMLRGLEGCRLGVNSAHAEGMFYCPDDKLFDQMLFGGLCPIRFVDDDGIITKEYPFNPNGSPRGVTAVCSDDGRHLWTMMHLERSVQMRQWQFVPENLKRLEYSPWLLAFENMRNYYR